MSFLGDLAGSLFGGGGDDGGGGSGDTTQQVDVDQSQNVSQTVGAGAAGGVEMPTSQILVIAGAVVLGVAMIALMGRRR